MVGAFAQRVRAARLLTILLGISRIVTVQGRGRGVGPGWRGGGDNLGLRPALFGFTGERVTACQAARLEQPGEQMRSWTGVSSVITAPRARAGLTG